MAEAKNIKDSAAGSAASDSHDRFEGGIYTVEKSKLSLSQRESMLRSAFSIKDQRVRIKQLTDILQHLDQNQILVLIKHAGSIEKPLNRAHFLAEISKHCDETNIFNLITEASFMEDEEAKAYTFGSIVEYSNKEQASIMYDEVKTFTDKTGYLVGLGQLAPYLNTLQREEIAHVASNIDNINARRYLITCLSNPPPNVREIYDFPKSPPILIAKKEEGYLKDVKTSIDTLAQRVPAGIKTEFVEALGGLVTAAEAGNSKLILEVLARTRGEVIEVTPNFSSIPKKAPKLWAARGKGNRQMSPAGFIADVYGPWLGVLKFDDLLILDPLLAGRYRKWVGSGNTPSFDLPLPRQERARRLKVARQSTP